MGFRITIGPDSAPLAAALRTAPEQVFSGRYAGYMLFLVGEADPDILDWLTQNLINLDALTGRYFAFGIFAKAVTLDVAGGWQDEAISQELVIDSDARLRQHGSPVTPAQTHRLRATCYAVDELARSFDVLGDLPCMILVDALPAEQICVVPLTTDTTRLLIGAMRRAFAAIETDPKYQAFLTLLQLERQRRELGGALKREQERLLAQLRSRQRAHEWLLLHPDEDDHERTIRSLQRLGAEDLVFTMSDRKLLAALERAAGTLRRAFALPSWPPPEKLVRRLRHQCARFPCGDPGADRESCRAALEQVGRRREDLLARLHVSFRRLPPGALEPFDKSPALLAEYERVGTQRRELDEKVQRALEFCVGDLPSLSRHMLHQLNRDQTRGFFRRVGDAARVFGERMLDPHLLLSAASNA